MDNQNPQSSSPLASPPPQPPVITQPATSHKPNMLYLGLGAVVLLAVGLIGGYMLRGMNQTTPSQKMEQITQASPTLTQDISPTTVSSPTKNPTANWKTYSSDKLGHAFNYPDTWYLDDQTAVQPPYVRIQNYSLQAEGRGYDANLDKGKTYIVVMKRPLNVTTISQLKTVLAQEDKQSASNDMPVVVKNEKESTHEGLPMYTRETTVGGSPSAPTIYILDGKGNVIQFALGLDVTSGIDTLTQLVSTFKFTN